jgi:hypothetical protein
LTKKKTFEMVESDSMLEVYDNPYALLASNG